MTTVNGDRRWMVLDYEASSLYSAIADGQYRSTFAGNDTWMSVIAGSSSQSNCNREGFNIQVPRIMLALVLLPTTKMIVRAVALG